MTAYEEGALVPNLGFATNWECVNPATIEDPAPKCTLRLATATEGYEFMPRVYDVTFPIRSVLEDVTCTNYYEDLPLAD